MADQKANQYIKGFSGLTHADISAFVGKTLTVAEQTLCTTLIEMAEIYFCDKTHRNYLTTPTYYDIVNAGLGSYTPSNFPIKEVTKITLDGTTIYQKSPALGTLVLGTDFFVFDDCVEFDSPEYSSVDNRNAMVIYYTIDTAFGADAKMALQLWVANFFLNREMGGKDLASLNAGGMTQQFITNVPDYIESVVNLYIKHNI